MPFNPPTTEHIIFPSGIDSFPTVYDANSANVAERYTKVWAEYHNKLRNFIGKLQPLCSKKTAYDGTLSVTNLSYWTLDPAPTLHDILYGNAKQAFNQGKSPPSHILPFEIVITNSLDNYGAWPRLSGRAHGSVPMLYQSTSENINKITNGMDFHSNKPMCQCTLRRGTYIRNNYFCSNWIVTSYCLPGLDTLVIRGSIIDIRDTAVVTSSLPSLSTHFPNGDDVYLNVVIIGAKS